MCRSTVRIVSRAPPVTSAIAVSGMSTVVKLLRTVTVRSSRRTSGYAHSTQAIQAPAATRGANDAASFEGMNSAATTAMPVTAIATTVVARAEGYR